MENTQNLPIDEKFASAILGQLLDLKRGFYITRDQMLTEANYPLYLAPLVNILVENDPRFAEFEGKRGRGYCRKS